MQIKTFAIPLLDREQWEEELNVFLRSHRIMTIDRQFCAENGGLWAVFVTWQEGSKVDNKPSVGRTGRVDYREVLSPEEFERFAKYREIRKEVASQQGIPAYAVFTDEELSLISKLENPSIGEIGKIKGIGKRAEKYGAAFAMVNAEPL